MGETAKVKDASSAEEITRIDLISRFGRERIISTVFLKIVYVESSSERIGDYWDVEVKLLLKRGLIGKEYKRFRYRIDSESGRITLFELLKTQKN